MSKINSKVFQRVYWISVMMLLAAGNAWAEEDIPPFDPFTSPIFDTFRDMWDLLAGWVY